MNADLPARIRADSAEARLILACARVRAEPADRIEIAAAIDSSPGWERVLRLARWHGLRPLLHRGLESVGFERVPRPVQVALWRESEGVARGARALARELARVTGLLRANGIRVLPFKGPTLAQAAYGDVALRESGDLDILVARPDVPRARGLLGDAGYALEYALAPQAEAALLDARTQYQLGLRHRVDGHRVELHWKSDRDHPVERLDADAWWEGTARVPLDGVDMPTFAPEELMLVLCIHGSKHHWSSLAWVVDVAELLRHGPGLDWPAIAARAGASGCRRRVGVGLYLAAALLDAPLAPAARELASHPGVAPLAQAMALNLVAPEPEMASTLGMVRMDLALYERSGDRIRHLQGIVFLPSPVEWVRWPLPRGLFFLYPALRVGRLAAKYLGKAGATLRRAAGLQV